MEKQLYDVKRTNRSRMFTRFDEMLLGEVETNKVVTPSGAVTTSNGGNNEARALGAVTNFSSAVEQKVVRTRPSNSCFEDVCAGVTMAAQAPQTNIINKINSLRPQNARSKHQRLHQAYNHPLHLNRDLLSVGNSKTMLAGSQSHSQEELRVEQGEESGSGEIRLISTTLKGVKQELGSSGEHQQPDEALNILVDY